MITTTEADWHDALLESELPLMTPVDLDDPFISAPSVGGTCAGPARNIRKDTQRAAQRPGRIPTAPQPRSSGRHWLPAALILALCCFWAARPAPRHVLLHPDELVSAAASRAPKFVTASIEDLRIHQRVMALNPEVTDDERAQFEEIDPVGRRVIHCVMQKPDGGAVRIQLSLTLEELAGMQAKVGGGVELQMPELGVEGVAQVLAIEPAPAVEPGPGRPITGLFEHTSADGIDLFVTGQAEPIGVTREHPFWSEDRQDFIPAGELQPGENLRTADWTPARVISATSWTTSKPVYNIEVDGEHVYYVTEEGILVHNVYGGNQRGSFWQNQSVFPTSRTTLRPYRVRGSGRGGVTKWAKPENFDLKAAQRQWIYRQFNEYVVNRGYSSGVARDIIEGQIRQQRRSARSPFLKGILDELFGG